MNQVAVKHQLESGQNVGVTAEDDRRVKIAIKRMLGDSDGEGDVDALLPSGERPIPIPLVLEISPHHVDSRVHRPRLRLEVIRACRRRLNRRRWLATVDPHAGKTASPRSLRDEALGDLHRIDDGVVEIDPLTRKEPMPGSANILVVDEHTHSVSR